MESASGVGGPRIGLIGVNGYGRTHVHGTASLEQGGRAELAAYADVSPDAGQIVADAFGRDVPGYGSALELLQQAKVDIAVISTPIHLHAQMIEQALTHGVSVLVEKPPVVTVQDFERLHELLQDKRLYVQVGFQTAGSPAVSALGAAVRDGSLGDVELIGAVACWQRSDSYYSRSAWAGKLMRQGLWVLDGTLTNPLAHALMNCLLVAGDDPAKPAVPETVQAELYRCRSTIEGDDTSSVRITTKNGHTIVLATTLCARQQTSPYVFAKGTRGTATVYYTEGRLESSPADLVPALNEPVERNRLLANLVDVVRGDDTRLVCPLELTESYVRTLNGMYESAGRPRGIPAEHLVESNQEIDRLVYLQDIETVVETAAWQGKLFSETGIAGWAQPTSAFELDGYREFRPFRGLGSSSGDHGMDENA